VLDGYFFLGRGDGSGVHKEYTLVDDREEVTEQFWLTAKDLPLLTHLYLSSSRKNITLQLSALMWFFKFKIPGTGLHLDEIIKNGRYVYMCHRIGR